MIENKTTIPVKQIFKIALAAMNLALLLMLFDTQEEVRALQQETSRLEELKSLTNIPSLLEAVYVEIGNRICGN